MDYVYELHLFTEFERGSGYKMINDFEQLRKSCRTSHHCSHYSSELVDFDLLGELGESAPAIERALGEHPFGDWPRVIRTYSRDCPAALTWFASFDTAMKNYLQQNQLRILGVAPTIISKRNDIQYFAAIFLGNSSSQNIECQNRNCNETSCQYSFDIDIHAKAIHRPTQ